MRAALLLPALAALLAQLGCADWDFRSAARLEKKGEAARAAAAYEKFIERHPKDRRFAEAATRAGTLYAERFGRCAQAVPLFEKAARTARGDEKPEAWPERARIALLSCPDYFPLSARRSWVYVDSASGGENMRLETLVLRSSASLNADVTGAYFAGENRTQDYRRQCTKEGWTIWETASGSRQPILKYPFRTGHAWDGRQQGKPVRFEIVQEDVSVQGKAGKFSGCLKVKSQVQGYPSWVYDYYCPGVGRVKTTVGVPGVENPNTELASYKAP
jgi:hypothetical protein